MEDLKRYSLIEDKFPREFLLLKGSGCRWKKCIFCDYYLDVGDDYLEVNKKALDQVTGRFGVLDIINSGSMIELHNETVSMIKEVVDNKNINTLWFESHWMYRNKLKLFSSNFPKSEVKYRVGVETFDKKFRNYLKKGISDDVEPGDIAKYFKGVCLLVGLRGQTKDMILRDIDIAIKYFEYFSVNVFNDNTSNIQKDIDIINWIYQDLYKDLKSCSKAEILLNNTDLGVG